MKPCPFSRSKSSDVEELRAAGCASGAFSRFEVVWIDSTASHDFATQFPDKAAKIISEKFSFIS